MQTEKIQTVNVTTNQFGSFHGAFVIPVGGLNGSMRIKNESGSISFSVEEYKLPTFEVLFDTLRGKYRLGDEITVTGKAENFAGSKLQNVKVTYRVVQSPMILPYYDYRPFPLAREIEIANETVFTNEDGTFTVRFLSLKQQDTDDKLFPQRFTVYATVTDITGEVQSSSTDVILGNNPLLLGITTSDKILKESNDGIQLSATNLSGNEVEVDVDLEVFKLNPPDKVFTERYWSRPDITIIPRKHSPTIFRMLFMTMKQIKIPGKKSRFILPGFQ